MHTSNTTRCHNHHLILHSHPLPPPTCLSTFSPQGRPIHLLQISCELLARRSRRSVLAVCGWLQAAARAVRSASTAACGIERQRGRRGCRATQHVWVHDAGRGCAFGTAGTQKQNVFLLLQCPSACMAYCLWPWWARGGFSMTPCRGSIPRAILIIVQCLGCFVVCIFTYSSTDCCLKAGCYLKPCS